MIDIKDLKYRPTPEQRAQDIVRDLGWEFDGDNWVYLHDQPPGLDSLEQLIEKAIIEAIEQDRKNRPCG